MGQKVNPNGFRTGVNKNWNAAWIAPKREIAATIKEDQEIRVYFENKFGMKAGLNNCSISKVVIERQNARVIVNVWTGRPGIMIGQKGAGIETIKKDVQKFVGAKAVEINIKEVKNPDVDAVLIAQSIATQLEKRVSWRRAMKMAMQKAIKSGVQGVKVMVGGRLDGADIARSEFYKEGTLPLHTLRSDIEYGVAEAKTTFGIIGVKCWICFGEIKGKTKRLGEVVRSTKERPDNKRNFSHDRENRGERRPFNGERKPFDPNRKPPFNRDGANNGQGFKPRAYSSDHQFVNRPRTPRVDGAAPAAAPAPKKEETANVNA
jgi:small subunit ribosomal protein S3